MTTLLWAALRARRGTALMTFVLALLAAAFATAGPLYEDAALRAVQRTEVAAAPVEQHSLRANRARPNNTTTSEKAPIAPHVAGYTTVNGLFLPGDVGLGRQAALTSRSGSCERLRLIAGRCATATNEVVARQDSGFTAGQDIDFFYEFERQRMRIRLTVVGLYHHLPPDTYWGIHDELIGVGFAGPLITTAQTLAGKELPVVERVDLVLTDPLAVSRLEEVERLLDAGGFGVRTELPDLADRIEASRTMLRAKLTAAVASLVLTCWFVLFLAVSGAVRQRRDELGLVAMRGVPAGPRWALPSLETTLPVLAGALPGYVAGLLAIQAFTGDAQANLASVLYCAAAVAGAVAAGIIAQAAAMSASVHSLLQRVVRRGRPAWRRVVEPAVATLAVALGYQVAVSGERAAGLSMLAPLCLAAGLGVLAARLTARPAESMGRRALRRGRVNLALSLLQLARRPGNAAVVVLLTVAVGLLGFTAASAVTLHEAWEQRAAVQTAAPRVLTVDSVLPAKLLAAVRQADPSGRQAMAVALLEATDDPPLVAVDTTRLTVAAVWPQAYGGVSPAQVARSLRPYEPRPLRVRGTELTLRITVPESQARSSIQVAAHLTDSRGEPMTLHTKELPQGTGVYPIPVARCADGCRLDGLELAGRVTFGQRIELTLHELRDESGPVALADQPWLPGGVTVTRADGLHLRTEPSKGDSLLYADVLPGGIPMISPEALPKEYGRLGVIDAGHMPLIPRWGGQGVLLDLEYATLSPGGATLPRSEVWLAEGAGDDVVNRLRAVGLTILSDRTAADRLTVLNNQAPALSLRFLIAAAAAGVLIGGAGLLVIAWLERARPEDGLGVLRPQGLGARAVSGAARGARYLLLALATVVGLCAATVSWFIARRALPPYIDGGWQAPPPQLDGVPWMALAVAAGAAILALACRAAARISTKEQP